MYKTLFKKIKELEIRKTLEKDEKQRSEIQGTINKFQGEMEKIQSMFPDKFF